MPRVPVGMGQAMIATADARLASERRFLAALFLYPHVVDIERHHFLAAQHGILFECIRDAFETFPWPHSRDGAFDDVALAIVLEIVKQRAREVSEWMGRPEWNDFHVRGWAESYFHESILSQAVTSYALDDLRQQVRECPRCGR